MCLILSDEYMALIAHTEKEAKRLDMEISLNFGRWPGWIIGGIWYLMRITKDPGSDFHGSDRTTNL